MRPVAEEVIKSQDAELSRWGTDIEEGISKCCLKIHSSRIWWLSSD